MKRYLIFAVLAVAVVGTAYWYWQTTGGVATDDAVIEGNLTAVAVTAPGVVREVHVGIGEEVKEGQLLVSFDDTSLRAGLERESAELSRLEALLPSWALAQVPGAASRTKSLEALRSEEETARRAVENASLVEAAASVSLARMMGHAVQEYAADDPARTRARIARDEATFALARAKENFERASYARAQREALDQASLINGQPSPAALALVAEYQNQADRVEKAGQALALAVLTSPVAGTVVAETATPGTRLNPGDRPVVILLNESPRMWITARFAKDHGPKLTRGRVCRMAVPGRDGEILGRIAAVLPGQDGTDEIVARILPDQERDIDGLMGKTVSVTVVTRGES